MKKNEEKKLTTRHWVLYNLIKQRTLDGMSTTCRDICAALPEHYTLNTHQTHHYSNCPAIYKDCQDLNLSAEIEKVVVVGDNDFHLARSEKEAKAYARTLAVRGAHRFKRYWAILDKCKADGQGKLVSCQNKQIDEESAARRFVEAFLTVETAEEDDGAAADERTQ